MSSTRELKAALTVRANENPMGFGKPKAFKVYREVCGKLIVPRFFEQLRAVESSPTVHSPTVHSPTASSCFSPGNEVLIKFNGKLRPHQEEALSLFKGNGVLCLPCGQGKTMTAIAIAAKLNRKTLVIVHKEFLASQWIERIKSFTNCKDVGRIQGSIWNVDGHEFVIAMIQTLCTREFSEDAFDIFGTVIVDEAHHIGAPAFSQVMLRMRPQNTLGLTATPERKDGLTKLLYWFLCPAFYTMNTENNVFSINKIDFDYPVLFKEGPHLNRLGKICMSTMVTELTTIPERNEMILEYIRDAQKRGRKSLVLSDRRQHCEYLYSQLDPKITCIHMGGYKGFPDIGGGTLISTFSLAYEGLDIPELDTLFLTTPHSDVKQAIGRITRSRGDTKEIWDFVDNWSIFKLMWYKRKKTYYQEDSPGVTDSTGVVECLFSA